MAKFVRFFLLPLFLLLLWQPQLHADDSRFDLIGPRIDVRVTRDGVTLPISQVPNLLPGDRLWLHPDFPADQSARYLLICAFLRGSTNPPPDSWFTRIETWDRKVREEGAFVIVPKEAQQVVLFMAPETGGDFSTLRKAVEGRPGVFVRASQDLTEAGFEQARIEKYLSLIRRVPPSDPAELLKRSNLLARTLALKPNADCFKQPVDTQFTCLTQTGSQTLLDDSHAQSVISALSNGPNSDFINEASYTSLAEGGLYSAYVGAVVDLVRIMGSLHTAQYQYIPAIAFPQDDTLNLRLNSPPSFRNPKSVLVIGLPSVQKATPPPLRPADSNYTTCLLKPSVTLPIEGAPLVFSTSFAHDLVLHFNVPPGAPAQPDVPLIADAFQGGLVLQQTPIHHTELPMPALLPLESTDFAHPELAAKQPPIAQIKPQPEPILLTGTVEGKWGFGPFTGPTLQLQQLPGGDWHIVDAPSATASVGVTTNALIAGHNESLLITSTGSACVHTISAHPTGSASEITVPFKRTPTSEHPNRLTLTLPLEHDLTPGDLHLSIQQYGQPIANVLSARTFAEPAHITSAQIHAADRTIMLHGMRLSEVDSLTLGDLVFKPSDNGPGNSADLMLSLPANAPIPPTYDNEHLTAVVALHDGRTMTFPLVVTAARPAITLLSKTTHPASGQVIDLPDSNDLPIHDLLTFTIKSATRFPRNGEIEIETDDGTLRTVLTLAPSGGLLLQDPHTIVASLDPEGSFGPSAFGPLQLRAVFPPRQPRERHGSDDEAAAKPPSELPTSDWIPLATLVRLPDLTLLQCPIDPNQSCTLTGSNLFLLKSISTVPNFTNPIVVPDGFTGSTLSLPQPVAGVIYVRLRDDPGPIDPANVPTPAPPPPPPPVHTHERSHAKSRTRSRPLPPVKVIPIPAPDTTVPVPATSATPPPASAPQPSPSSSAPQ